VTPNESNAPIHPLRDPPRPPSSVIALPSRDVRQKRPPALAFLLRRHTLRRFARVASLLALDFAGVTVALFTASWLKILVLGATGGPTLALNQTRQYLGFAFLLTVLLFARAELYADRPQRPGFTKIASSLFQVMLVSLIFALATHQEFSSYYIFYGSLFFAVMFVSLLRDAHLRFTGLLLSRAGYRRRALLVGSDQRLAHVSHGLKRDSSSTPFDVVGSISLDGGTGNGVPSLGTLPELGRLIGLHRIQEVIIADPDMPEQRAIELVDECHQRGVTVHLAPSTVEILINRAEFLPGQSVPLFTLKPPVFDGFDFALKRTFDLVGASLLLIVLSPVLAAIAVAVRLSSRGPVLYRSVRPGMGATPFACLKFRTMTSDADQAQADLESSNEASGPLFKIRRDPRLTTVGRLLRRFSLDELPQLWNVVRGHMSLVGPRPLPLRDFEQLEEWHKKRYLVLPGITGLWQVSGRSELDFDDLVRLDFLYLERWSVFLDVTILLKTVPAVLSRRGAF
jgi:exopolysaccharide biosynthesis polyprenyl glycosylphosphotransferase